MIDHGGRLTHTAREHAWSVLRRLDKWTMTASGWFNVATFSSGFEADLAISRLEAAGIRAVRDDNDTVGIFGPGFQGTNPRGVTVRVPASSADEAREVLRVTDHDA